MDLLHPCPIAGAFSLGHELLLLFPCIPCPLPLTGCLPRSRKPPTFSVVHEHICRVCRIFRVIPSPLFCMQRLYLTFRVTSGASKSARFCYFCLFSLTETSFLYRASPPQGSSHSSVLPKGPLTLQITNCKARVILNALVTPSEVSEN